MSRLELIWLFIAGSLLSFGNAVAIIGAQGGVDQATGQRPFRQEFSTFKNSGPAFDLYILSLQQFMQQNQSSLLSYYQVSGRAPFSCVGIMLIAEGIHGHPYIPWDGVQGQYQAGYCTHGSILFPSWHRPYMALYEVRSHSVINRTAYLSQANPVGERSADRLELS